MSDRTSSRWSYSANYANLLVMKHHRHLLVVGLRSNALELKVALSQLDAAAAVLVRRPSWHWHYHCCYLTRPVHRVGVVLAERPWEDATTVVARMMPYYY